MKALPPLDHLQELLTVDPTSPSGLRWKQARCGVKAGSKAGSLCTSTGYWVVGIDGQSYGAHRIVYAMTQSEIPEGFYVDHIDGNRQNNSATNLRLATPSENQWNSRTRCDRKSGLPKNISSHGNGYQAKLMQFGKYHTYYSTSLVSCITWLGAKRQELHGQYARSA
ncbi:HNH endonuclease [Pseudomonas sp. UBA4102]